MSVLVEVGGERRVVAARSAGPSPGRCLTSSCAAARGYDTALAAYLDKDDIDTAVYRNLISAVHDNLQRCTTTSPCARSDGARRHPTSTTSTRRCCRA